MKVNIYWSTRDFRLHDNPAMFACVKSYEEYGVYFFPIFMLKDYMMEVNPPIQLRPSSQSDLCHKRKHLAYPTLSIHLCHRVATQKRAPF